MELVNLTEYLVKQILPEVEVKINKIDSEGDTVIQVLVPNECMSVVIGKGGKIANSIRTVVRSSAKKNNKRVNISFK